MVGSSVGLGVGELEFGVPVGDEVGSRVGFGVGLVVGISEGGSVGEKVGLLQLPPPHTQHACLATRPNFL